MRGVGTMLGTCCVTVMAEGTCPVLAMQNLMQFYNHESCGQCTPCREGSAWLDGTSDKILDGKATMAELDALHDVANSIMGNTICAFGEGTAMPALALPAEVPPRASRQYVAAEEAQRRDAHAVLRDPEG